MLSTRSSTVVNAEPAGGFDDVTVGDAVVGTAAHAEAPEQAAMTPSATILE